MKKIFLFLAVFIFFRAGAQVKQKPTSYGLEMARVQADSAARMPTVTVGIKDFRAGFDTAQYYYNKSDSSVYTWTGYQWIKLRGGAAAGTVSWGDILGTLSDQGDLQDSLNERLTSVYRRSDSVFYVKNSTEYFAFIDSTGGAGSVSISQGYGILNSPNPITGTGSVTLDSATVAGYLVRRKDSVAGGYYPYSSNPRGYLEAEIQDLQDVTDMGSTTSNLMEYTLNKNGSMVDLSIPNKKYVDSLHGVKPSIWDDTLYMANVINYGAISGDGLSDQTAFSNAQASGLNIYIPPGTYDSVTISLDTAQMILGIENKSIMNIPAGYTTFTLNENAGVTGVKFLGTGQGATPAANTDYAPNQAAVKLNKNKNLVQFCTFQAINGAGVYGYNTTTATSYWRDIMFYPDIQNNDFMTCAVAIYFRQQFEYSHTVDNTIKGCGIGIFERRSANHSYLGNQIDSCNEGLRVNSISAYNGDHSTVTNGSINHSSSYAINFEQVGVGYIINGTNIYYGEIGIGTASTATNILIVNCGLGIDTITATSATHTTVRNNYYFSGVVRSGSGVVYIDNIGSPVSSYTTTEQGWNSSGYLGIGTSTPTRLLHVAGKSLFTDSLHASGAVRFSSLGTAITDTSAYKPVVMNTDGDLRQSTYWYGGGGSVDSLVYSTRAWRDKGDDSVAALVGAKWDLTGNTVGAFGKYIGTNDNYTLRFRTNGTERWKIDSSSGSLHNGGFTGANASVAPLTISADAQEDVLHTYSSGGIGGQTITNTGIKAISYLGTAILGAAGLKIKASATAATAHASSIVDIESTGLGFLYPRMTTTQQNAISSPATGLQIFNTTDSAESTYRGIGAGWSQTVYTTGPQTIGGNKTFTGTTTPTGRLIVPMGEISYFNTTGTSIVISGTSDGSSNMVAVNPTTALSSGQYEFDNGGANDGGLRYTGTVTKMFHIAVTVSGTPATASDVFVFGVAKNGTVAATSKVLGSSSGTQFSSLHSFLELATNDELTLYMGNTSGSRNFTVKSLNIFAMGN